MIHTVPRRCQSNISIAELIEINRTQSNYWCSIAEHNRTSIEHEKFGKFRLRSIAFDCSESEHNRTITGYKRISIVFDQMMSNQFQAIVYQSRQACPEDGGGTCHTSVRYK